MCGLKDPLGIEDSESGHQSVLMSSIFFNLPSPFVLLKSVCALSSPVDSAQISEPSLFSLGCLGLVVREGRRIRIAFGIFLQSEPRIMMHSLSLISCYGHVCNGWFSFSFLDILMSLPFFRALLTTSAPTRCRERLPREVNSR